MIILAKKIIAIILGVLDLALLVIIVLSFTTGLWSEPPKGTASKPGTQVVDGKEKETKEKETKEKETKEKETSGSKEEKETSPPVIADLPPEEFSTNAEATLADFQWASYEILHGILPSGIEMLDHPEEVRGGWKAYIIDDPYGEYGSLMEYLANIYINADENAAEVTIDWDYAHNGAVDEGYTDTSPDSVYSGGWAAGRISANGSGSILLTDFWYQGGKEYAFGMISWPDTMTSAVFMVRP